MLLKKCRNFFFKFRSCRNFFDNNNYINNSYLNYVQANKNINNKSSNENKIVEDNIKTNNENIKNLENFNDVKDVNNKGEFSLNNGKNNFENYINNIELNETVCVKNNNNIKNKSMNFNDNENASINKQENKKKSVEKGSELYTMNNENLSNTFDLFDEKERKKSEYMHKGNKEKMKEDIINKKSEKNRETSNKNPNNNLNNFYDINDLNNLNDKNDIKSNYEHESLHDYDSSNGENHEEKFTGLDEDITYNNVSDLNNDPLNAKENEINGSNYSNDSYHEGNSESTSNKKNSNSSNTSCEDAEKWIENEEDIPNIFEVDENLSEEEKKEKLKLIKLITEKLAGPLKTNNEQNPKTEEDSIFGDNRPIAIEVDGPSHFYANSNRYTTYTKLKHRILTKLGYNVIHISYIDWRKLRNKSEREEFILKKLKEKNDEFLDDDDRIYYNERMNMIKEDYMKYMKQKKEKNE